MKTEYIPAFFDANPFYAAVDDISSDEYLLEKVLRLCRKWIERIPETDYRVFLRNEDIWLKIDARDASGEGITVEFNMSRMVAADQ